MSQTTLAAVLTDLECIQRQEAVVRKEETRSLEVVGGGWCAALRLGVWVGHLSLVLTVLVLDLVLKGHLVPDQVLQLVQVGRLVAHHCVQLWDALVAKAGGLIVSLKLMCICLILSQNQILGIVLRPDQHGHTHTICIQVF